MNHLSKISYPKTKSDALKLTRALEMEWSALKTSISKKEKNIKIAKIKYMIDDILLNVDDRLEELQKEIQELEERKNTAEQQGFLLPDYNQKLIKFSIDAASAESVKYTLVRWAKRHRIKIHEKR